MLNTVNQNLMRPVPPARPVSLRHVFRSDCLVSISPGLRASSVIQLLVDTLADTGLISHEAVNPILEDLLRRERHHTTGIGGGIAIPHLRTPCVRRPVGAIGLAPTGCDFRSLDGFPTKVIFLFLSPWNDRDRHMHLLMKLASLTCVIRFDRQVSDVSNS